jgi:hypothetical protein
LCNSSADQNAPRPTAASNAIFPGDRHHSLTRWRTTNNIADCNYSEALYAGNRTATEYECAPWLMRLRTF